MRRVIFLSFFISVTICLSLIVEAPRTKAQNCGVPGTPDCPKTPTPRPSIKPTPKQTAKPGNSGKNNVKPNVSAQNYAEIMYKNVRKSLNSNGGLKGFEWLPLPTTNYGLMTSFNYAINPKPNFQSQWCAGFSCLGIDPPSTHTDLISMNGYADVGATGSIRITEAEKKDFSINILLPQFFSLIGADSFNKNSVDMTTMSFGTVHVRSLRKGKVLSYLQNIPDKSENAVLKTALQNKKLGLVVADVIIDSMDVTLKYKGSLGVEIETTLAKGNSVSVPNTSDSKKTNITLKLSKNSDGTYRFVMTQPIIVARLIAQYPIFDPSQGLNPTNQTIKKNIIDMFINRMKSLQGWRFYTKSKNCTDIRLADKTTICVADELTP